MAVLEDIITGQDHTGSDQGIGVFCLLFAENSNSCVYNCKPYVADRAGEVRLCRFSTNDKLVSMTMHAVGTDDHVNRGALAIFESSSRPSSRLLE